jgi:hypothetical protein
MSAHPVGVTATIPKRYRLPRSKEVQRITMFPGSFRTSPCRPTLIAHRTSHRDTPRLSENVECLGFKTERRLDIYSLVDALAAF